MAERYAVPLARWHRRVRPRRRKDVDVTPPVIADLKMEVAKAYGMPQSTAADTMSVHAVFFIDP